MVAYENRIDPVGRLAAEDGRQQAQEDTRPEEGQENEQAWTHGPDGAAGP